MSDVAEALGLDWDADDPIPMSVPSRTPAEGDVTFTSGFIALGAAEDEALDFSAGAMPAEMLGDSALAPVAVRDDGFLEATLRLWQPRTRRPLARTDAADIITNMSGFFRTLLRWSIADAAAVRG